MDQIKETIFNFFKENGKADGLTEDTNLFKKGYVNSLFAIQMVTYLEDTFSIKLGRKDISEKNFQTINTIAALVARLKG